MKKIMLPLLVLFSFAIGCIESNPQPSPVDDTPGQNRGGDDAINPPKSAVSVDDGLMYASAPGETEEIIVVGEAGAAMDADGGFASGGEEPPAGEDGDEGDDDASFGVNDDGSFVVVVPKVVPPKIILVFTYPDLDDVVVELSVPGGDRDDDQSPWMSQGDEEPANGPPAEYDGFEAGAGAFYGIVASDLEDGTVEVVGGFLSVTPLAKVVLANIGTGETVVVQATNTGEFVAQIGGTAGDTVSMFAVNPDAKEQATSPLMLIVE